MEIDQNYKLKGKLMSNLKLSTNPRSQNQSLMSMNQISMEQHVIPMRQNQMIFKSPSNKQTKQIIVIVKTVIAILFSNPDQLVIILRVRKYNHTNLMDSKSKQLKRKGMKLNMHGTISSQTSKSFKKNGIVIKNLTSICKINS